MPVLTVTATLSWQWQHNTVVFCSHCVLGTQEGRFHCHKTIYLTTFLPSLIQASSSLQSVVTEGLANPSDSEAQIERLGKEEHFIFRDAAAVGEKKLISDTQITTHMAADTAECAQGKAQVCWASPADLDSLTGSGNHLQKICPWEGGFSEPGTGFSTQQVLILKKITNSLFHYLLHYS